MRALHGDQVEAFALGPVLIVHGGADTEVHPDQADAFCRALQHAGRTCALSLVDGASHRPENWWPSQLGYKGPLAEWLAATTGLARPDHEPYVTALRKNIVFSPAHHLAMDAWTPPGAGPFPAVIVAHEIGRAHV